MLAGWTLGVFWLAVIVGTEHVWTARKRFQFPRPPMRMPRAVIVAVIVAVASVSTLASVAYLTVSYSDIPPRLCEIA